MKIKLTVGYQIWFAELSPSDVEAITRLQDRAVAVEREYGADGYVWHIDPKYPKMDLGLEFVRECDVPTAKPPELPPLPEPVIEPALAPEPPVIEPPRDPDDFPF